MSTSTTETDEVRAIQFNGLDDYLRIVEWMKDCGDTYALADEVRYTTPIMLIQTPEGTKAASPGDWIVRGIEGGFYPAKRSDAATPTVRTYRVQYHANIGERNEMHVDADGYFWTAADGRSRVAFHRDGRTVAEVGSGAVIVIEEHPAEVPAVAAAELDADGKPTPAAVLALPMERNDAGAATIREYLVALAKGVWVKGEDFSANRPFGNSGWHVEVHQALGAKGWIRYETDGDGYIEDVDEAAGNELIAAALKHLAAA